MEGKNRIRGVETGDVGGVGEMETGGGVEAAVVVVVVVVVVAGLAVSTLVEAS